MRARKGLSPSRHELPVNAPLNAKLAALAQCRLQPADAHPRQASSSSAAPSDSVRKAETKSVNRTVSQVLQRKRKTRIYALTLARACRCAQRLCMLSDSDVLTLRTERAYLRNSVLQQSL
jgi:hypothetical protein